MLALALTSLAAVNGNFVGGRAAPKKVVKKAAPKKVVKKAAAARSRLGEEARSGAPNSAQAENDIGVTPPLGLFDPLGFLSRGPAAYRRYQEMEIKHGRICMAKRRSA